jgi:hypothetical protein
MHDRPCTVTVTDSSGTISQAKYTYNAAGHPTQTSKLVGGSTYLTSYATYNANGTVASVTDANSKTTNYYYNGTGGCNNLLLTSTILPLNNLTTSQTWDCNGGVVTSASDANTPANVTNYYYIDPLWRPTKVTYPDGGSTSTTYSTSPWTASTSTAITSSLNLNNTTMYDGLGRVSQTQLTPTPTAPTTWILPTIFSAEKPL